MSGLMTTRPESMAAPICPADQSAHRASPVMTSSSTHESTRVAGRIAAGSVATQQRHDLVGAQAGHVFAGRRVTQPPGQTLTPGFLVLTGDDLQMSVHLYNLDRIACVQPVFRAQVGGDRHLSLAVQHHGRSSLPSYVIHLLRNTRRA